MTYQSIYTTSGLTSLSQAVATGTPILLTQMAVGDGGGNPTTPSQSQTTLVRELFRASVNRVYQDPTNPTLFTAELVIPATVGGFTLREVGVFDSHGSLFAVGNLPDTYKPVSTEGAFADTVVRVEFVSSNTGVITLQVDPNVAVATQSWIINNITPATIIPGGTTGQLLAKHSNANGDFVWQDPTVANVVVQMIEEDQTLAASQTVVTLATTTTNGLAVYIEGVRLRADEWTATDATHVTLGSAYPAGTKFTAVQNEPAGTVVYPLAQSLNLSDVPDKAAARANLGVPAISDLTNAVPPGIVDHFAGSTPPTGWLARNGAAISRTAYAALFAAIGTTYGAGDGFNTFNLPDDRGVFDRGFDGGRGYDSGRTFGSYQADALQSHQHAISSLGSVGKAQPGDSGDLTIEIPGGTAYTQFFGAVETRPKNRAYLPIIKY